MHFSIYFFVLSSLFLGTLKYELNYWETGTSFLNILCLFLILTIGISHGALDHLKGYKLLNKYKISNNIIFYIGYLLIGLAFIFLWLVIPSLTFFIVLPVLLKYGISFYISLSFSIAATIISYYSLIKVLNKFGIEL